MALTIIALADQGTKAEIESRQSSTDVEWIWVDSLRALVMVEGDAYFDFQFHYSQQRVVELRKLNSHPVFVSSMEVPCKVLGEEFIRINSWPGMLGRPLIELASPHAGTMEKAMKLMQRLTWEARSVPDLPGFISARILAAIINEAFYTLEAGVSSLQEINTAMKLGTNYPAGPFEWAEIIGTDNVHRLLTAMSIYDNRYTPCPMISNYLPNQEQNL